MKRTFNLVTLASLLVFAVACGKSNESGSKSNNNLNLLNGSVNLSQTSTQAVTNFQTWYNSTTEGQSPVSYGAIGVQRSILQQATNNGCDEHEILGFITLTTCFQMNNTSNGANANCYVTMPVANVNTRVKHLNTTLKKIAETPSQIGQLVDASQSGPVINLVFLKSNQIDVVVYTIDTSYHSAFQPVQKQDSETGEINVFRQSFMSASGLPVCQGL